MTKTFYSVLFLFFFGFLNLGTAQNTFKKNEFAIFTGIIRNEVLFGYGNNLGIEAHHSFTKKIGIAASISLGNGYKNYSDKYGKTRPFFYSTDKLEMTFAPFKRGKWRISAGLAHQYLPDVSFLGNAEPYIICIPSPSAIAFYARLVERRAKLNKIDVHLLGYSCSIERQIRINSRRNLLIRLDNSFFSGKTGLSVYLGKVWVTSLNVGWVF
jgi:hypothetical protein